MAVSYHYVKSILCSMRMWVMPCMICLQGGVERECTLDYRLYRLWKRRPLTWWLGTRWVQKILPPFVKLYVSCTSDNCPTWLGIALLKLTLILLKQESTIQNAHHSCSNIFLACYLHNYTANSVKENLILKFCNNVKYLVWQRVS